MIDWKVGDQVSWVDGNEVTGEEGTVRGLLRERKVLGSVAEVNRVEEEFWARFTGVHPEETCKGQVCVVHNPLDHHMREWPMVWREDRLPPIVERICECGVGHYDFSQWEFHKSLGLGDWVTVHGCCGHCTPPSERNNNG